MNNISPHQEVLFRNYLGIEAQVSEHQLLQIKLEQDQKGEPYLLEDIIPMNEQNHEYVSLQKGCTIIMIILSITNMIFQTKGMLNAKSVEERNVNIGYTLNTMLNLYLVY